MINQAVIKMERIKTLENMIQVCRELYYSNGTSPLTDVEYDALENELKKLDPNNTLLNQVGSYSMKDKVKHIYPMLSLDKIHSLEELNKFTNKFSGEEIIAMPKIDGLPIEAVYIDGVLSQASTRGDGKYGESVIFNAKYIKSLPQKISNMYGNMVCIYGEVVVPKEDFERINAPLPEDEKFSDARNLAAGTLKCEDAETVKSRNLTFIGYRIENGENSFYRSLNILNEMSLYSYDLAYKPECIFYYKLKVFVDLFPTIEKMEEFTNSLWYKTDGIVFMLNNMNRYEEIGCNNRHPKYACALKFKDESMTSTVEKIELSMSRNGTLSPVAIIKPIILDGAEISRVSMTNIDNMILKNVVADSTVEVVRANKVIPKIISGEFPEGVSDFEIPKECPYCHSKILIFKSETGIRALSCNNTLCHKRLSKILEHFCDGVEIDNMGEKNCDKIAINFIDEYEGCSDRSTNPNLIIYHFLNLELGLLESYIGSKVIAKKIFKSINDKKSGCRKVDFIAGLGIDGFGRSSFERLTKKYGKVIFDELVYDSFIVAEKYGNECSISINAWKAKNMNLVEQIIGKFIFEETVENKTTDTGKLSGMTICITGTFSKPRNDLSTIIKSNGGCVSDSVTKSTNILLAGEDCGSKLDKAKKLKIKIINEEELERML